MSETEPRCHFCQDTLARVEILVELEGGPNICDACVEVAAKLIAARRRERTGRGKRKRKAREELH